MSGANGCQGVSWSEELDGKELLGALGGERDLEPRGSPLFGPCLHGQPTLLHRRQVWYADFKGVVVAQTYDSESLIILTYARSLLLQQALFGEGLRELVQLIIRGECLIGDDSIAYDRSFA